ncbi:MAG: HEAT repeat domain-containing protein [Myxococcales bacterium]|nr:HEAT repeat domain-containing protein [Myxococcales bacterium]
MQRFRHAPQRRKLTQPHPKSLFLGLSAWSLCFCFSTTLYAQSSKPSSRATSQHTMPSTSQPSKPQRAAWQEALQLLQESSVVAQEKGIKQLQQLGPQAKAAVPTLFSMLDSSNVLAVRSAKRAFVALGLHAVPALLQRLQNPDRAQRFYAQTLLARQGRKVVPFLMERYPKASVQEKESILDIYAAMGPEAASAGQQILQTFSQTAGQQGSEDVRLGSKAEAALIALQRHGATLLGRRLSSASIPQRQRILVLLEQLGEMAAPALPALVSLLSELPLRDREPLVRILGQMQSHATAALPILLKQLKTPLHSLQLATVVALGQIHSHPQKTLPVLQEALQAKALAVRVAAAYAIGRFPAPEAQKTLLALRKALQRQDPVLQAAICQTLAQIGPAAVAALPELRIALTHHQPDVQLQAIRAIGALKEKGQDATNGLIRLFTHRKPSIRKAAARAVAQIGPPSLPALILTLRSRRNLFQFLFLRRSERRNQAAIAIGLLGPQAEKAIPALIWALSKPRTRRNAAWALGKIGPKAASALPTLLRYLSDRKVETRVTILEAIGSIGYSSDIIKSTLLNALSSTTPQIRQQALLSMSSLSPAPIELLPRILSHLLSPQDRNAARKALRRFGLSALPILQQSLHDKRWEMRTEALHTLAALAPTSVALLPSILKQLQDTDYRVRAAAVQTLAHFPQQAQILLPILQKLRNDPVPYVQMEVSRALKVLSRTP